MGDAALALQLTSEQPQRRGHVGRQVLEGREQGTADPIDKVLDQGAPIAQRDRWPWSGTHRTMSPLHHTDPCAEVVADPRVPLDDRIVLRHTGDVPTQKTISLPDGACRALTLTAHSIADNLVQS